SALGTGFFGQVIVPGGVFGALYGPLAFFIVLTAQERRRLLRFGRGKRAKPRPGADDPAEDPIEERE
ncbi:MAG: hypothetical protein ACF8LK_04050, partial [Phycisphaerales bacterium JB041]